MTTPKMRVTTTNNSLHGVTYDEANTLAEFAKTLAKIEENAMIKLTRTREKTEDDHIWVRGGKIETVRKTFTELKTVDEHE